MRTAMMLVGLLLTSLTAGCAQLSHLLTPNPYPKPETVELFDKSRGRPVPIAIYGAPASKKTKPLAIISHGYGNHYRAYAFLANDLVERGYVVASIQHLQRPGDPPMIFTGDHIAQTRLPIWKIGAANIAFVAAELKRQGIADPAAKLVLAGHSNGGDMSMYFANKHPQQTAMVLSLDNRRMPLPRISHPHICSIRSVDQAADPGVLPDPDEQKAKNILVANLPIPHNSMWDGASNEQKQAMLAVLSDCLDETKIANLDH